jgi:hypothetical protein
MAGYSTFNLLKQRHHSSRNLCPPRGQRKPLQLAKEMHQEMMCCGTALFNDSDERSFGQCLAPKIALFRDFGNPGERFSPYWRGRLVRIGDHN